MPDKVKEMPKKPNIVFIMGDDIGWLAPALPPSVRLGPRWGCPIRLRRLPRL
jgi:hypothetical protein